MLTSEESFAHCRKVAKSRARNFYYSFTLLPRAERDAMCAIYAFMRRSDDITDNDAEPVQVRREQLIEWRDKLADALQGGQREDRILPAFSETVHRYEIPQEYFFELIAGMESDLLDPLYGTFDDLYRYCYQAAAVVGMATIHVFGFESPHALPLAEKCGIAFQLTNIMRDVREDARLGRVYFPETELRDFGMDRRDLLEGAVGQSEERFQSFMEFQWSRAANYYDQAFPLVSMVSSRNRPALWAMVAIYRELLGRIRRSGFGVLDERIGLSVWSKLWIVTKAMRLRFSGGVQSFPG